jgi:serine/threonine protein kinase
MDEVLNQRYLLTDKLGQGGFGAVYQATDLLLDREVAVKVLNIKEADQDDMVSRFLTEAKIASKLNHPNTLTIYDFGRNKEDCCYLVSELLLGESLHERLARAVLPVASTLEILFQVSLALKEAHYEKIVHRDIKPANIFLHGIKPDVAFTVKLLDFGIAKMLEGTSNTVTGQMMGTPHYMSPEQIINIKLVDHRTDIYSLGIVFFHMLTGLVPYDDDSYYAIMRHHMQSPMPLLELDNLSDSLVNTLQDLLTKMTIKDVRKRITSIDEVILLIQEIWIHYPYLKQNLTATSGEHPSLLMLNTPYPTNNGYFRSKEQTQQTPHTRSEGEGYGTSADTLLSSDEFNLSDENLPQTLAPAEEKPVEFSIEEQGLKRVKLNDVKSPSHGLSELDTYISTSPKHRKAINETVLPIRDLTNGIEAEPNFETLKETVQGLKSIKNRKLKDWFLLVILFLIFLYISTINLPSTDNTKSENKSDTVQSSLTKPLNLNKVIGSNVSTTKDSSQHTKSIKKPNTLPLKKQKSTITLKSQEGTQNLKTQTIKDSANSDLSPKQINPVKNHDGTTKTLNSSKKLENSKSKTQSQKTKQVESDKANTKVNNKTNSKHSKTTPRKQEIKVSLLIKPLRPEYDISDQVRVVSKVTKGKKRLNRSITYKIPSFAKWIGKGHRKLKFTRAGKGHIKLCYRKVYCDLLEVTVAKEEDLFR